MTIAKQSRTRIPAIVVLKTFRAKYRPLTKIVFIIVTLSNLSLMLTLTEETTTTDATPNTTLENYSMPTGVIGTAHHATRKSGTNHRAYIVCKIRSKQNYYCRTENTGH